MLKEGRVCFERQDGEERNWVGVMTVKGTGVKWVGLGVHLLSTTSEHHNFKKIRDQNSTCFLFQFGLTKHARLSFLSILFFLTCSDDCI